ncbi:RRP15-like protein [Pelobates fuscus]|uniref:RRP15-like protein n=1 Tax=Pelobates fuscus TaxID=191477 RepID=UPI002FE47B1A
MEVISGAEQLESADSDIEDNTISDSDDADSEDETELAKGESEEMSEEDPNKGWAEAMAKILKKKVSGDKSSAILVKSKAVEKEKEKENLEKLEKKKQIDKKRQWEMMCRVKPDVVKDKEAEKNLQRIATRGVVQLFNAVRTHQGNINEKIKTVGRSERKRSKLMSSVSKKDFINVLRGKESKADQASTETKRGTQKIAVKSESDTQWSILRDDFMMGASMKDWDKNSDDGAANADPELGAEHEDSGSDSD